MECDWKREMKCDHLLQNAPQNDHRKPVRRRAIPARGITRSAKNSTYSKGCSFRATVEFGGPLMWRERSQILERDESYNIIKQNDEELG